MITVDARGLSCPEPVILTKRAAASAPKEIQVAVDNNVSKENVCKFLQSQGYTFCIEENGGDIVIHARK